MHGQKWVGRRRGKKSAFVNRYNTVDRKNIEKKFISFGGFLRFLHLIYTKRGLFDRMDEKKLKKDFVDMLSRSESMLYEVCMMYTDHSVEQVHDLFQEIACRLWEGYPGFRGESKETTWVWRVAVNTARMSLRKERRRPVTERLPEALCETMAEEPPDPLVERLYELIDRLPHDDKTLLAHYLNDMPVSDIAEVMHRSKRSVERRISELKTTLKRMNETED